MPRAAAVAADGNIRVAWCVTLTAGAPTVAQLNAGVDLSYYLTPDGLKPNNDEAEVTDDRLADTQTFQNRGRVKKTLDKLRYVFNPSSAPDNLAYSNLVPGTAGYLAVRWGVAAGTAWAIGQKVDVWPVTVGERLKEPPEANTVLHAASSAFVTNTVGEDITVA
jgi:hypothetical protein